MPSGIYLRTINGIFFSRSSLIAICSGSVSPSKSTRTGAFILLTPSIQYSAKNDSAASARCDNQPDLQCPRAQNARSFVLGHIGGSRSLLMRDLLVFWCLILRRLVCPSGRVSRLYNRSAVFAGREKLVRIVADCYIVQRAIGLLISIVWLRLIGIVIGLIVGVAWGESGSMSMRRSFKELALGSLHTRHRPYLRRPT